MCIYLVFPRDVCRLQEHYQGARKRCAFIFEVIKTRFQGNISKGYPGEEVSLVL